MEDATRIGADEGFNTSVGVCMLKVLKTRALDDEEGVLRCVRQNIGLQIGHGQLRTYTSGFVISESSVEKMTQEAWD